MRLGKFWEGRCLSKPFCLFVSLTIGEGNVIPVHVAVCDIQYFPVFMVCVLHNKYHQRLNLALEHTGVNIVYVNSWLDLRAAWEGQAI